MPNNFFVKPCRTCSMNCKKARNKKKPSHMPMIDWIKEGERIKEKGCAYVKGTK